MMCSGIIMAVIKTIATVIQKLNRKFYINKFNLWVNWWCFPKYVQPFFDLKSKVWVGLINSDKIEMCSIFLNVIQEEPEFP